MASAQSDISEFHKACASVRALTQRPTDEELLGLYALYKQATVGDCTGPRPMLFNVKARGKYDAWQALRGMETGKALKAYCRYASTIVSKYS